MSAPILLNIVGPPAVGKMTVGHELSVRTGMPLFHNHMTIDLVTRFFEFGTPPFNRLVGSFRRQILTEVAASDLPGMIFTFVWAFDLADDTAEVDSYCAPFRERGARVLFVELQSTLEERLRRNRTEFRLTHKPAMQNTEWSETTLLELDGRHELSSGGRFDGQDDWLRIDNTDLSPAAVADVIVEHFALTAPPP